MTNDEISKGGFISVLSLWTKSYKVAIQMKGLRQ